METIKNSYPTIIQGGMGVNISNWVLAKKVSMLGEQGTISGTMLEWLLAHTLQSGDLDGNVRRVLARFPYQKIVDRVMKTYFVEGGLREDDKSHGVPMFNIDPGELLICLVVCANFVFVSLAKEGHNNPVSVNYLEKVAMPHIYALTGAMLAGADIVTMGAGIPHQIPKVMSQIQNSEVVTYDVPVEGTNIKNYTMTFDIKKFFGGPLPEMKKPKFLPIISTNLLASVLIKKVGKENIYGFVVEEPTAGGHNAPPRNKKEYSEKDYVDYKALSELGLPCWIGGSYATPEKRKYAISVGAQGIQAGSIFALSEESGMRPDIRRSMRFLGFNGLLQVKTDMQISPTGYPFKVAQIPGTISEAGTYYSRKRICNRGGLVILYERSDNTIGRRCSAEPVEKYVAKGGDEADTVNSGCLCNGLFVTAGINPDSHEPPVATIGDDVSFLKLLMNNPEDAYTAEDAINYLKGASVV